MANGLLSGGPLSMSQRLGEILVAHGAIDAGQLHAALMHGRSRSQPLGASLVELRLCSGAARSFQVRRAEVLSRRVFLRLRAGSAPHHAQPEGRYQARCRPPLHGSRLSGNFCVFSRWPLPGTKFTSSRIPSGSSKSSE